MSPLLGWCLTCAKDAPISPKGRCLRDNSLVIPPSFGSKEQRLVDGAWFPEKASKPTQKGTKFRGPSREPKAARTCEFCERKFVPVSSRNVNRFCGQECSRDSLKASSQAKREARRSAQEVAV
jgi:hypothetical protein